MEQGSHPLASRGIECCEIRRRGACERRLDQRLHQCADQSVHGSCGGCLLSLRCRWRADQPLDQLRPVLCRQCRVRRRPLCSGPGRHQAFGFGSEAGRIEQSLAAQSQIAENIQRRMELVGMEILQRLERQLERAARRCRRPEHEARRNRPEHRVEAVQVQLEDAAIRQVGWRFDSPVPTAAQVSKNEYSHAVTATQHGLPVFRRRSEFDFETDSTWHARTRPLLLESWRRPIVDAAGCSAEVKLHPSGAAAPQR